MLYLVRHPRPADAKRMCYGRRDMTVSADDLGEALRRVRDRIPEQVLREAHIVTSPAGRCERLARELAAPRQPTVVEDLREMGFGAWEGRAWDDIPRAEIDAWAEDVWGYRAGGDESAAMVRERWRRFAAGLRAAMAVSGAARDTVAVTHSGVIRVALVGAGLLSEQAFPSAPIEYGAVHPIDLAGVP